MCLEEIFYPLSVFIENNVIVCQRSTSEYKPIKMWIGNYIPYLENPIMMSSLSLDTTHINLIEFYCCGICDKTFGTIADILDHIMDEWLKLW